MRGIRRGKIHPCDLAGRARPGQTRPVQDRAPALHHHCRSAGDAGAMPRPKSGPRLWLDKERQAWSVIDGRRAIRTGCGKGDLPGAQKFLEAYLAAHHTEAAGADPLIADVLKVYSDEHLSTKVSAYSVSYDMDNLTDWWGAKTVGEITTENCRAYIKHRDRPTCCRRELGFLAAAATYWHKNRAKLNSIPVIV